MCHICAQNSSDRFMHKHTHIHTHTFSSGVVDREWHHGLLVICQDCDSLCQLSTDPTNGHKNVRRTHAHWPTYSTVQMHTKAKIILFPIGTAALF